MENAAVEVAKPKSVVFAAMTNLQNELCHMLDCGERALNYPEGAKLRVNLHPDGKVSHEMCLIPCSAPEGSQSVEFELERFDLELAMEGYEDTGDLTQEIHFWKDNHQEHLDSWIKSLLN